MEPYPIPDSLAYRRQYYDAGEKSRMRCGLCGNAIRFVFILKDPIETALHIGKCCFYKLKEPNPTVYEALVASLILLRGQVRDAESDTKEHRAIADAAGKEMSWKAARQAARRRIREYRKSSGEKEWLPKPFFDLQQELHRKPRRDYKDPRALARWYDRHAAAFHEILSSPTKLWI